MASERARVEILEAQMQRLQATVIKNASSRVELDHLKGVQEREKEEWQENVKYLEKQVTEAWREAQNWKREAQGSRSSLREREGSPPSGILHRSLSSQSLPVHASIRASPSPSSTHPSPPPSLQNYPLHSQMKPTPLSSTTFAIPLATGLNHSHNMGGSNSSLSSVRSANAMGDGHTHFDSHTHLTQYGSSRHKLPSESSAQHFRMPFSSTPRYPSSDQDLPSLEQIRSKYGQYYRSTRGDHRGRRSHDLVYEEKRSSRSSQSPPKQQGVPHTTTTITTTPSPPPSVSSIKEEKMTTASSDLELQRSKLKIKQLQKEVSLLDDQLSDKSRSARGHVEELMLLRTQLAQEKASLAIVRQEIQEQAAREVGAVRGAHERRARELEGKLRRVRTEREKLEGKVVETRTKLKGVEAEQQRLEERVVALEAELEAEREGRRKDVGRLQREERGQVSRLEAALQDCREELRGHVTKAKEGITHQTLLLRQVEGLSKEVRQKDKELGRKVEREVRLQHDLASLRAELQQGHASWQEAKEDLKNRLIQSESAREGLLRQLSEASREATLRSARLGGTEEALGELERCRGEVQRLEGVVSGELAGRGKVEAEVRKWRREKEKLERRCKEGVARQEAADKRWQEERSAKEACEAEGEELRKEVGRLSQELLKCQHQLQAEMEGRAEKEKETEDSLTHLQQELAKRAQQVLEMDRLLQGHQAETTAKRLQLERTLTQRQAELKGRTQEVEQLTAQAGDHRAKIGELSQQLTQARQDQKTLFSGSQAQLLAQDSKVSNLEVELERAECLRADVAKEAGGLRAELEGLREKEGAWRLQCQQLQEKVKALASAKDSLHAQHLTEVQSLQGMQESQLSSHQEQADLHRQQLQQLTLQEKVRQEELSRCRIQVASLSAELSAEHSVSEESRQQVAAARSEASKYQAQVARLEMSVAMLQGMFEQQAITGSKATPTPQQQQFKLGGGLTNGSPPAAPVTSLNPLSSEADFVMLPNHLKAAGLSLATPLNHQTQPTTPPQTPPTPTSTDTPMAPPTPQRGGIISV